MISIAICEDEKIYEDKIKGVSRKILRTKEV